MDNLTQENIFDGLLEYKRESLYKIADTHGEERKNIGFDFSGQVMKRTLSDHLFRKETLSNYLMFIDDFFTNLINAVKRIRISNVFSVDKDYKLID